MSEGRLADRAYTAIVRIITEEDLAIGDRLPSESRLAETFGMSRTIVREALARLASDGITEARRGAGSYVKRRPSARLGSHMPMDALAATLGTYEVRFVLEAEAARLAAQRRSPEQMDAACTRFAHRVPLLANMVEGGKTPIQDADALQAHGFRIAIFPGGTARAVVHTLQGYYGSLHRHRTTQPWRDRMLDFDGLNDVIGTPALMRTGQQYD